MLLATQAAADAAPSAGFLLEKAFLFPLIPFVSFLLILFFPFTRLVHILVVPNPYLWRKPQVVRWYRRSAGPTH